ncbi:MAG: hypothetical protein MUC96_17110 [Myxococcaceae bacterium]|jgi:hypothetical protein|nr:hypothetical protein [Myxococcaceae bacterium]
MSSGKKPGDETLRVPPGMTPKKPSPSAPSAPSLRPIDAPPTDSFVGRAGSGLHALGNSPSGPQKALTGEAAPEVSQGAWRERVFTPRAVMSKDEIVSTLESSLRVVLGTANHARVAFEELRRGWLPTLRQALEQGGGDGLDAWLSQLLKPPGRTGLDPLVPTLVADFARLRAAKDLAAFEEEALKVVETVRRVLAFEKPRKLSFKVLERELEGKLEIDELFLVAVSDDGELSRRLKEIGATMESLRDQLKKRPGKQPDGMYSNFVRLKAEVRVLDAELRRRGTKGG